MADFSTILKQELGAKTANMLFRNDINSMDDLYNGMLSGKCRKWRGAGPVTLGALAEYLISKGYDDESLKKYKEKHIVNKRTLRARDLIKEIEANNNEDAEIVCAYIHLVNNKSKESREIVYRINWGKGKEKED